MSQWLAYHFTGESLDAPARSLGVCTIRDDKITQSGPGTFTRPFMLFCWVIRLQQTEQTMVNLWMPQLGPSACGNTGQTRQPTGPGTFTRSVRVLKLVLETRLEQTAHSATSPGKPNLLEGQRRGETLSPNPDPEQVPGFRSDDTPTGHTSLSPKLPRNTAMACWKYRGSEA